MTMRTTSTAPGLCAWMCVHGEGQRETERREGGEEGERHFQLETGKDSKPGAMCAKPGQCGRAEGVHGTKVAGASYQAGREWKMRLERRAKFGLWRARRTVWTSLCWQEEPSRFLKMRYNIRTGRYVECTTL